MEDTRATHNGNPQLISALHQNRHRGKENERTGFVEKQSATALGWEEKSLGVHCVDDMFEVHDRWA